MKARYEKLVVRIDALTLRERVMLFAAVAVSLLFMVYMMMIAPLFAEQARLRQLIAQQDNNIKGVNAEITSRMIAYGQDPDAPNRKHLAEVRAEIDKLGNQLRNLQKGLVAPEKIAPLLGELMRANGHLRLVAMKTLPVTGISEAVAAAREPAPPATAPVTTPGQPRPEPAPKVQEVLYRHGVEITLQGSYLDMIAYMHALENMPTQLLWGKASLDAQDYPNARLTLTLYTLSLDPKWLKL